jgi:hypothetical protein
MGVEGTHNLFNRMIAETFTYLEKESHWHRKPTEHQTNRTKEETPPDIS